MSNTSGKKVLFTLIALLALSTLLIYFFVNQMNKGPIRFTFVDALALGETEKVFDHTVVGGFSALRWNEGRKFFVAVSDDPSVRNPARFYNIDIQIKKKMKVKFKRVNFLKNFRYYFFDNFKLDMEGLAIYDNYNYFLSSEGNIKNGIDMRLLRFDSSGQLLGELPLPEAFLAHKDGRRGPQHNRGLEGLSFSPNKKHLFAAMENSLIQDDTSSDFKKGAWIRILHYQQNNPDDLNQWQVQRQYLYPLNPVIKEKNMSEGRNGVSEILAYSNEHLLVLERHHLKSGEGPNAKHRNIGQIFLAYLDPKKDISSMPALKTVSPQELKALALKKELIFDLDRVLKKIKGLTTNIDNVEGMTWGPPLGKSKSLLIVSDNNFSDKQKTLFLLFKVKVNKKLISQAAEAKTGAGTGTEASSPTAPGSNPSQAAPTAATPSAAQPAPPAKPSPTAQPAKPVQPSPKVKRKRRGSKGKQKIKKRKEKAKTKK